MMDRQLVILYGSQTGTAMDLAKRIRKQAKLRHFSTSLLAMNDFPIHRLASTSLIVFVCSVTGQGDEPDNMKTFWRALRRRDLPAVLHDVEFAVLGIGDSSYQNFNITAIRLDRRLRKLGAKPFVKIGLADESHDHGIDFVADPWITLLMEHLMEKFPLPPGQELSLQDEMMQPSFNVQFLSEKPTEKKSWTEKQVSRQSGVYDADHPFYAHLLSNERATAEDHLQNVRFMRFNLAGSSITYNPGDTVNVFAKNQPEAVDELLTFLELDGDQLIFLSINDEDFSLPPPTRLSNPCTIRVAATNYWDFQGVPRKSFFELLAQIAQDERQKERLSEFASAAGTNDLFDYCFRPRRNALEILHDFSDTAKRISFSYFFDLFPPIQARAFSIASSPRYHKDELHLLVAVVQYKTKLHRPRKGLCSNWLASLEAGTQVPVWIKKGTIKFDQTKDKPVVMVGPGTGVAPFRSFIYERVSLGIGNSVLFFGCRNKAKDFYFEKEWEKLQEEGLLSVLPPAFSRDQEEKVYVQDSIRKAGAVVVKSLVEDEGFFYLAGSANSMPKEVEAALKKVLCEHAEMEEEEAVGFLKQLASDGRFKLNKDNLPVPAVLSGPKLFLIVDVGKLLDEGFTVELVENYFDREDILVEMNWIQSTDLYNRLNRTWDRTVCLSRPHYMLILDVRPKNEYDEGHLPTAKRVVKDKDGSWQVTGGWEDITNKETIVLYDMSTSHLSEAGLRGPLSEAASFVWRLLKGSRNQFRIYLLNGGFERFTEYYPNCKSYEATYTIGELGKLQVLPLHIPLITADLPGKLFYCPPDGLAADRVAHMLCDIDTHVNCTRYRDPTFGFSPDENAYVHHCVIDNQARTSDGTVATNLKELYDVCLFIHGHLKDERNVLVYGERGDTVATSVLVAFLVKCESLDVEEALQVVNRAHPLTVIDETSRACLEVFGEKIHTDPTFQTGVKFSKVIEAVDLLSSEPTKPAEPDNKLSLVASIVAELIPEFDKRKADEAREGSSGFLETAEKVTVDINSRDRREGANPPTAPSASTQNGSSGSTAPDRQLLDGAVEEGREFIGEGKEETGKMGMPVKSVWSATKELTVSREDVRRFEEETLWKMLHHDRVNPPIFGNVPAFSRKDTKLEGKLSEKEPSPESQPQASS